MIERLKELLRHSAIYGLGSIVARVLGVLLLPLYTRYLSPTAYVAATLANVAITIIATVLLVVVFDKGPLGVLVGNFTGTLFVYAALLLYSRHALGLQFDRSLYRAMNRFGLPLVPSAVALWL